MPMNVKPVPTLDDEVNEVRLATAEIVNNDILPNEGKLWARRHDGGRPSREQQEESHELRIGVQNKVKKANLWAPHLPPEFGGMGLSFMQHAYMNEVLAYSPGAALAVRRRCPELRQPEDPRQVRHAGTAREVADSADRRPHAVGFLHDGTAQRRLRPALHPDPRRA